MMTKANNNNKKKRMISYYDTLISLSTHCNLYTRTQTQRQQPRVPVHIPEAARRSVSPQSPYMRMVDAVTAKLPIGRGGATRTRLVMGEKEAYLEPIATTDAGHQGDADINGGDENVKGSGGGMQLEDAIATALATVGAWDAAKTTTTTTATSSTTASAGSSSMAPSQPQHNHQNGQAKNARENVAAPFASPGLVQDIDTTAEPGTTNRKKRGGNRRGEGDDEKHNDYDRHDDNQHGDGKHGRRSRGKKSRSRSRSRSGSPARRRGRDARDNRHDNRHGRRPSSPVSGNHISYV